MVTVPQSSGDLIADRRLEWARAAQASGDLVASAELLAQTVELTPGYAAAWFILGEVREALGDSDGARDAFEQARTVDPHDRLGATLQLARLYAGTANIPPGYVRAVFDAYARGFDVALVEGLGYRAPELLRDAVAASGVAKKFGSVLDLGCGTGLTGAAFRPYCDWLAGVDLSPGMIAQARGKCLYDRLVEADVTEFLTGEVGANYHLVLAGDVFVYMVKLDAVLFAAARAMAPGGLLAFTVETHTGQGALLRETLRYAHGEAYVREALTASGFAVLSLDAVATRTEKGEPVPSLVVVAKLMD